MTPSDNSFTISPHNLALLHYTLLHSYPVPLKPTTVQLYTEGCYPSKMKPHGLHVKALIIIAMDKCIILWGLLTVGSIWVKYKKYKPALIAPWYNRIVSPCKLSLSSFARNVLKFGFIAYGFHTVELGSHGNLESVLGLDTSNKDDEEEKDTAWMWAPTWNFISQHSVQNFIKPFMCQVHNTRVPSSAVVFRLFPKPVNLHVPQKTVGYRLTLIQSSNFISH